MYGFLSPLISIHTYTHGSSRDMEEINHFSHEEHPLKLINGETIVGVGFKSGDSEDKQEAVGCFACLKPISPSDSAYGCTQCQFFLHKSCAQLPLTINLPSIHHPLKLINMRKTRFETFSCSVCRLDRLAHGLCYSCNDGPHIFAACINCCVVELSQKAEADAIKEEAMVKMKHEGHPGHTLTLQLRPASFRCDACHTKDDDGLFYQCDSCDFWIHKTCASLASTFDLPHHPNHPLVLVYSLPENFHKYAYYCEFCNIYIRRNEWLYHCANCRLFAHIKCALNASPPSTPSASTSGANEDAHDLLHFPMPDVFTDPLKLLHLDKLSLDDNDELEIKHWSHRHPLILNVEPQHNNTPSTSDSIEVCYGCVRPLSCPYYSCSKDGCSFTLHKYCAQLPLTLEHQLHPDHSLDLVDTSGHRYSYKCTGCYSYVNTFVYRCETSGFHLCVNCAYLPNIIKHKTHNHPLIQVIDPQPLCKVCNQYSHGISYTCKACEFQLDMYCAMRCPQSLAHRYCKGHDEVLLTYPPVENHPEDFYCDICEEEMHPKLPLYHCQNHKNSFHLYCLSRIDRYANIWGEGTITVPYHKHPLKFVRRQKGTPKYVCSTCNQDINGFLVLECRARVCNFNICCLCHLKKIT